MNDNNMKSFKFVYISLLGILATACTDELTTSEYGKGEGRLVLSDMNVETVVGDVITRASLDESVLPQVSDFTIDIVDTQGETVMTLQPGTLQCKLSAGTYTLKATYGDAETMSATPAFYGEQGVTITEGEVSNVTIDARLNQTVIHPNVTADLAAHFEEYKLTISKLDGESVEMENDKDFFIPSNGSYTLTFSGTNKIGEDFSYSWQYEDLAIRTRYIVECNPDLPAFTLPEQPEGNVWSKFIYITPMTADNMTAHKEDMAQKVIDNVVYEVSLDGTSWIQSEKTKDGKIVIKGLEPSTTYTLRSRFGAVNSSNTQQVTTESAQQLENGDMESWSEIEYTTYGLMHIYLYYAGKSSTDKSWGTRNTLTMNGVENGTSSGTNNQITAYRWNSCTIPTDDAVSGKAAEIRTMALANFSINSGTVGVFDAKNHSKMVQNVLNNANIFIGYLYTGIMDVSSMDEPDQYGISHSARPVSLTFDYKYLPYETDEFVVSAVLYDKDKNKIAYVDDFSQSELQDNYFRQTLNFNYIDWDKKPAFIFIIFKSGRKQSTNDVRNIEGNYSGAFGIKNPWPDDVFVGSVLKIDNVTLNYDF